MRYLITVLIFTCLSSNAFAMTGEGYLLACSAEVDMHENKFVTKDFSLEQQVAAISCVAYTNGILDAYSDINSRSALKESAFCLPKEVSTNQVISMMVKVFKEKPESQEYNASGVIAAVLSGGYPCEGREE